MLDVSNLEVAFGTIAPLSGVSFSLAKGQTLGIVGESGSGKSLTAMSIMGLLPLSGGRITAGSIMFDGQELVGLAEPAYRKLRGGRLGLITQNPMTSLDPLQKIGPQVDAVTLMESTFAPDPKQRWVITPLEGEVPSPFNLPPGCAFADRCRYSSTLCQTETPELSSRGGHPVACHFPL